MKNYLLVAIASLLMWACNLNEKDKLRTELDKAKSDIDSLMTIADERESTVNEFITSFNEVESNLDSVALRQNIILLNANKKGELVLDQKERINSQVKAINDLMETNRKTIAELNKKLRTSTARNSKFEKTVLLLNEKLAQKELELMNLNERLNALNTQVAQLQLSVDTLNVQHLAQSKNISEKTAELHTAYYLVGKSKELQVSKIIDREGGLLGIGKTSTLSKDFDKSKFTRIDYTKVETISINGDGIKIITSHPSDSYTLEEDSKDKKTVKNLTITNPEKFWSTSKYLVVVKS